MKKYVCDQCGKDVEIEVRDFSIPAPITMEDKHFCDWACVLKYAAHEVAKKRNSDKIIGR
jgi:hypothetical protein